MNHVREQSNERDYTKSLAQYIAGFSYEDMPSEVIARAKLILLDTLGSIRPATDPIYPGSLKSHKGRNAYTQNGEVSGLHAQCQAGNNDGRRTCLALLRNSPDRRPGCVVLRQETDDDSAEEP